MATYPSSVDNFVQQIAKDGIASPNRYWVEFAFPRAGVINSFNNSGQLSMMCTTAQMPGRQINTNEHKHENYPIRIPYSQGFDEITLGFTMSENLKERRFFELWQNEVVNVVDGTMNFYNDYTAPLRIYQLNKFGEITYGVHLIEAFPTALAAVDYTYAANNETLNSSVTISYRNWLNIDHAIGRNYRSLPAPSFTVLSPR